ncbi:MAG: SHOCT domain-containing protein [Chloroflexota bacterium]
MDVTGMFDAIVGITILGFVVTLAIPLAIVIVVIWAIRRGMPARRDPAEEALRTRLARGEIDMAEYQVRMRALRREEE